MTVKELIAQLNELPPEYLDSDVIIQSEDRMIDVVAPVLYHPSTDNERNRNIVQLLVK